MVTQILNFTKAAQKLNITQSALSQRIQNLEAELGTTLFIRDRAGLKLTETAVKLLRFCQTKKTLEEELLSQIKSRNPKELVGTLSLGGFSSITSSVLIPALAEFLKRHPQIHLSIHSKEIADLIDMLKLGEIDFMILDDRLDKVELERIPLGFEKNVLVEARDYHGGDVFLDHDENDSTTVNYFKKYRRQTKNIKRIYLDDIHGILAGLKNGLGRAIVPLHLIKNEKSLLVVNPKDVLEIPIFLYYYSQPFYSQLHQAIVTELTTKVKTMLTAAS